MVKHNNVDMPGTDRTEIIIFSTIMSTLAATVTAMLSKEEKPQAKVKTFIAGVCCGLLLTLLLMNFQLAQGWKDSIIAAGSAFVSTFWPVVGRWFTKYVKKKGDDIISHP